MIEGNKKEILGLSWDEELTITVSRKDQFYDLFGRCECVKGVLWGFSRRYSCVVYVLLLKNVTPLEI